MRSSGSKNFPAPEEDKELAEEEDIPHWGLVGLEGLGKKSVSSWK